MSLTGYEPARILELQRRANAVADHLSRVPGGDDDPLAAEALAVARLVHSHVAIGWLPGLAKISASTAMTAAFPSMNVGAPVPTTPRRVIGSVVDGMTEEERAYFQGFVDANATMVARQLSLLDDHPDYDIARLPDELRTLDSPDDWGWLAQLYLVEQYHEMVANGDVELQRDGDLYWVDPLDLLDVRSEIMSEIILAAVLFPGNMRPGGGISRASARTVTTDPPTPRDIIRTAGRVAAPPPHVDNPKLFDPTSLETYTYTELMAAMKATGWEFQASNSGGGTVFRDPLHRGRHVRVMPGYGPGTRPDPAVAAPYVVVSQNGRAHKVLLADNPMQQSSGGGS